MYEQRAHEKRIARLRCQYFLMDAQQFCFYLFRR